MKAALVVLDGWALNPDPGARDAVAAADTPNFDRLREAGAFGTLVASGRRVGLPEGQMGNSEVGHLNIGAGRVVKQESARVTDAIDRWRGRDVPDDIADDGPIDENEAILSAFRYAESRDASSSQPSADDADEHGGRVHFVGLVSDGGVHSYQSHLHALIELAAEFGVDAVTHAFTDGRDTSPTGGEDYLADLTAHADAQGRGHVATVSGRYYAMDRDHNWDRTRRAYDAIVHREAEHGAESAVAAVRESYDRGDTDEFVEPTLVESEALRTPERERRSREQGGPGLTADDAVVFFNFRSDRARQLTRMLAGIRPDDWGADTDPPDCRVVTMTEYDETFDFPVAFAPILPEDTLGEVLSGTDHTQLRIAETEKYAHVTYFLNGGREVEFDGEIRRIVESPDVPTYDLQPEMSAPELTDVAIGIVEDEDPDALVLNYANPDMVGHTGDFDAAVAAVEAVDAQLGRLVAAVRAAGGHVLVTADHGNADDMGTPENPHTAHTTNPVPLIYLDPDGTAGGHAIRGGGALADLAPTLLALVGVDRPAAMTGENLLELAGESRR
jgi:2,3-bisphosphoglycerate-independent phosphoglycerate mutase